MTALIFDLDGTLVDSLPGIAASLNRTLDAHGLPGHSHAQVRKFIGNGLADLIRRAGPAGADAAITGSLTRFYMADYAASWRDGTRIFPGIASRLAELAAAGFPMAVLSNKTHVFTGEIVRTLFPAIPFTAVLGLRDGIEPKPHPGGALLLANILGVPPEHCTLAGDSEMDILAARNAGMKSIAVTWGYHDRARLADAGAAIIIDDPAKLAT